MAQPYFPGGAFTTFELNPDQGAQLVSAIIAGTRDKMDKARLELEVRKQKLDEKLAEHEEGRRDLETIEDIFGRQTAGKAAGSPGSPLAGLVPQGATPQQSPEEMKMAYLQGLQKSDPLLFQQVMTGTSMTGAETRSGEMIKTGQKTSVQDVISFIMKQQELVGGLSPEQRAALPEALQSMIMSGDTLEKQRLSIVKKQSKTEEDRTRLSAIEFLYSGFRPAEGVTPEEFDAAKANLVDAMMHRAPVDPEQLGKIVPVSEWSKMAVANATKLQAQDALALQFLGDYATAYKASGGKLPKEMQTRASAIFSKLADRVSGMLDESQAKALKDAGKVLSTSTDEELKSKILKSVFDKISSSGPDSPGRMLQDIGNTLAGFKYARTLTGDTQKRIMNVVTRLRNTKKYNPEQLKDIEVSLSQFASGEYEGITLDDAIAEVEKLYKLQTSGAGRGF